MTRIFSFITLFLALISAAGRDGSATPAKNVIQGLIVSESGTSQQPVSGAYAIAYISEDEKPIDQSETTGPDGKFQLIVPENVASFKLAIHDKSVRYWDYKPKDSFSNRAHPHDMGRIIMSDKRELSSNQIHTQVLAAELLHTIGDFSATALLEKAEIAYRSSLPPDAPQPCRVGTPHSKNVSFHLYSQDISQSGPRKSSIGEPVNLHNDALDERRAAIAIEAMNTAEEHFYKETGLYADESSLEDQQRISAKQVFTPGFCVSLSVEHPKLSPTTESTGLYGDSYKIVAFPEGTYTSSPMVVLYSNNDKVVRYKLTTHLSFSPVGSKPIRNDFPLGIRKIDPQ